MSLYEAPGTVPEAGELWKILGEIYLVVEVISPVPLLSLFDLRCRVLDPRGVVLDCPLFFFDDRVCEKVLFTGLY